ncbi:MAG TPA: hypothetical protein VGM29_15815, partial [Polyangiaceae bacterium]
MLALAASLPLCCARAWAGPPFLTDDPEPVELKHWEFYAASQWTIARHEATGTSPHVEVNYGALPNLQLHAIVPAALAWTSGHSVEYGLGDIELGVKLRFIEERASRPQVGIFPLVTLPTGSEARGLGAGRTQALAPVWIQKSFGAWTTYGGGGVRFAPDGNAGVLGWLLQRSFSDAIALGVETFVTIPFRDEAVQIQANLGTIINLSELH